VAEKDFLGDFDLSLVLVDELDESEEHEVFNLTFFLFLVSAFSFFSFTLLCFLSFAFELLSLFYLALVSFIFELLDAGLLIFDLAVDFSSFICCGFLLFLLLLLFLFGR